MSVLFTALEQAQAIADVRELLVANAVEATVCRQVPGDERLYGSDDAAYAPVGTILVEVFPVPTPTIGQGIDAVASVLPSFPLQPEDRLLVGTTTYRVQTVTEQWLFGALTHCALQLVRLHGG
ncbi:MAG: hypothetical protein ACYDBB_08645 [Armatimonadota bacterium]